MKALLTVATVAFSLTAMIAQPKRASVVIGSMTTKPNALLIVNPPNADQGVLLPQLSTGQRMSMKPTSPDENGLIVFDKTRKSYYYWSDGEWLRLQHEEGPKTSFYSIDPVSFRALSTDNNIGRDGMAIFNSDDSFVTVTDAGLSETIIAPVNLPHHAVLREVKVYYMDNDDDDLSVSLIRKSLSGGSAQLISWQSSGADAYTKSQTFNSFNSMELIDLENYTYRLLVTFDLDFGETIGIADQAKQRLYGVTIEYQK